MKSGKISWCIYKDQVLKDIDIIKNQRGKITKIEWHCFEEVDESFIKNLKDELRNANVDSSNFVIIKY